MPFVFPLQHDTRHQKPRGNSSENGDKEPDTNAGRSTISYSRQF